MKSDRRRGFRINANIGMAHWVASDGTVGRFRPTGEVLLVGDEAAYKRNNREWTDKSGELLAARFFVGFNVGLKPTWSMDDVVALVERTRRKQKAKPDSTFLAQRGLYTGDAGELVDESGAQIIILNLSGLAAKAFTKQMEELADIIVHELKQERVIVEIQQAGVVKETFSWTPSKQRGRK